MFKKVIKEMARFILVGILYVILLILGILGFRFSHISPEFSYPYLGISFLLLGLSFLFWKRNKSWTIDICIVVLLGIVGLMTLDNAVDVDYREPEKNYTCTDSNPIKSANNVELELNVGDKVKQSETSGLLDCSYSKIISYEQRAEYVEQKITDMGDYWKSINPCTDPLKAFESYYPKESFEDKEMCYVHYDELSKDEERMIAYNPSSKKLLYVYRSW